MSARLDGHMSRSRHFGKEKNLLFLLEIEPRFSGRSAIDTVTLLTELRRFVAG
jgi:hypothetical protein